MLELIGILQKQSLEEIHLHSSPGSITLDILSSLGSGGDVKHEHGEDSG